jgi:hypothetical protein
MLCGNKRINDETYRVVLLVVIIAAAMREKPAVWWSPMFLLGGGEGIKCQTWEIEKSDTGVKVR